MSEQDYFVDKPVPFERILEFYSIRYYCGNCTHFGFVSFRKGTKKHAIKCSKCHCAALEEKETRDL